MPSAHAKLSPSHAECWMNCPGALAACEGLPDHESDYADDGTVKHEVASRDITRKPLPKTVLVGVKEYTVTDEMVEIVKEQTAFVHAYRRQYNAKIESEVKLQIGSPAFTDDEDVLWGTADVLATSATELAIMDFKFGYNEVGVEANKQLILYAIGAAYKYGWIHPQYRLVILQPGYEPKQVVYTTDELEAFEAEFRPLVKRALAGDSLLCATEKGCRWCRAKATCPEAHREQTAIVQAAFEGEDAEPKAIVQRMPLEAILQVLDKADYAKSFIKACEAHVADLLTSGQKVPGWKMVESKKHRRWKDEDAALDALKAKKLPMDKIAPRSLVSPAQIEKVLGKEAGKAFAAEHAFTPEGPPTLAPESDPRPAVGPLFTEEDAA